MIDVWKKPPADLKLSPDYVDIWCTTLKLPNDKVEKYQSLLSADELQLADRYKSEKRRNEFIITRGLLRRVLARCLDSSPEGFEFEYAEHDKPFLPIETLGVPVSFNVTHSLGLALIAVTLDRTIGIDIEHIRRDVEFTKLSKRFFSRQEAEQLQAFDEAALPAAFFACWTRKEAFVKALGDGISFGLSEFSVSVEPDDEQVRLTTHWDEQEAKKWSLINIKTEKDYIAALAVNKNNLKIRYWQQKE